MPTSDIVIFVAKLELSLNIQCKLDKIPICSCGSEGVDGFPDLEYTLNKKDYHIPKQSYVFKYKSTCFLKIMHHPTLPFYIMGLNFFNNYYTIFDQDNGRVGFTPSKSADVRLDQLVEDHHSDGGTQWMRRMMIVFTVILLLCCLMNFSRITRNFFKKKEDKPEQYEPLQQAANNIQTLNN